MFKFLQKMFSKEEPQIYEVRLSELQQFLDAQAAQLSFNNYAQGYFKKLGEIRAKLEQSVEVLKKQEVSAKDKRQVEGRIQNIVIGHKDNYARTVERFVSSLLPLDSLTFTSIDAYQDVLLFNKKLQDKLDQLAQQTAKSYQAAQHLFFEQVEPIFKLLGELNRLVKKFDAKVKVHKINQLADVQGLFSVLQQEIRRKEQLETGIRNKEEKITEMKKGEEYGQRKLKDLNESKEYNQYKELQKEESELNRQLNKVEDSIFSFFSKLQKPLKKYERIALDNKPIKPYLDDSLNAFWQDTELKIVSVLAGLKKSLNVHSLQFDEKQRRQYLELIERAEQGSLQGLREAGSKLQKEISIVMERIAENEIMGRIEKAKQEIQNIQRKMESMEKEISDLQVKLERIVLEKNKKQLVGKIREVLNVDINITD